MRRTAFALLLLIAGSAFAGEPKATLSGPRTARPGETIYLSTRGSVSDSPLLIEVGDGPRVVSIEPLEYSSSKLPAVVEVVLPLQSGVTYQFVATAIGITDGKPNPSFTFRHAYWPLVVPPEAPAPPVTPVPVVVPAPPLPPVQPAPVPTLVPSPPVQPPPPQPQANVVRVPLFAILAYDSDPAEPGHVAMMPVIGDPGLAARLKTPGSDTDPKIDPGLDVKWYAWPSNASTNPSQPSPIDTLSLRPYIANGGPPVLLIYDAAGKVYDASGNEVNRVGAAFKPPATSDAVVALFKRMRGQ